MMPVDLSRLIDAMKGASVPDELTSAWNTIPTGAAKVAGWAAEQDQPWREANPRLAAIQDAVGLLTSAGPGMAGMFGGLKSAEGPAAIKAVRLANGNVVQHSLARTHLDIINRYGIPAEDVMDTGHMVEGQYVKGPLEQPGRALPSVRATPDDARDYGVFGGPPAPPGYSTPEALPFGIRNQASGFSTADVQRILQNHSQRGYANGDEIHVVDHYTQNGVPGSQWITIPRTREALRRWLGY